MKWHYSYQDAQHGPVTDEEIKGLIAAGNITSDNLVWCEGMAGWEPISNVPELMHRAVGNMSAYVEDSTLSQAVTYSGFWRRVAAFLIDSVILRLVGFILGMVLAVAMVSGGTDDIEVVKLTGNVVGLFLGWLYFALMESSSKQATIGKQLMDIKVTDIDGNRISFARASGRYFGKILSMIILMIGFLMMLWTEKKQTLHDMMAGCLVVKSSQ